MYNFPNVKAVFDRDVCELYKFDLLKIPKILSFLIKNPLAVFQPESVEDLLEILKFVEKYNLPVIPRGAATSAYGGVVPLKRSVIIDMTKMDKFDMFDEKVIAESGAVWLKIEKKINKAGYALRVYPSSAPASTVGGWIAQNGYGIGSLAYGNIAENVEWLEVVDFEGLKRVSNNDLRFYVGAYGTTGIIVRACIKTRKNNPLGFEAFETTIDKAIEKIDEAYHASFRSEEKSKVLLIVREFGESNELGLKVWKERFYPLIGLKSTFSEVLVPLDNLTEFLEDIEEISKCYQVIFSKKEAVVFIAVKNCLKAVKIINIAEKYDGKPYGTGVLFKRKDEDFWNFKKKVDPKNLLNPKKLDGKSISKLVNFARLISWIV